jgi:hypothetical protein
MLIEKQKILGVLSQRCDEHCVEEAARELPDHVDSERDATLLQKYGVDPQALPGPVDETSHGEAGSQVTPPGFEAGPG